MQTIELSKDVKADEPLVMVIPAVQLTQHIGARAKIIVQFELPYAPQQSNDEWDAEWDALIERIRSTPTPPKYIKLPTKQLTQERLDELLAQDNNPNFDLDEWNAEWDAYEAEQKRRSFENEQRFLEDMMRDVE